MSTIEIKERLGKNFRPFEICLSDGRRLAVPNPDQIAVGKHVVTVIDEKDVSRTVDALHIVSIDENYVAH